MHDDEVAALRRAGIGTDAVGGVALRSSAHALVT